MHVEAPLVYHTVGVIHVVGVAKEKLQVALDRAGDKKAPVIRRAY